MEVGVYTEMGACPGLYGNGSHTRVRRTFQEWCADNTHLEFPPPVYVHGVLQLLLKGLTPRPLTEELSLDVVQLTPG